LPDPASDEPIYLEREDILELYAAIIAATAASPSSVSSYEPKPLASIASGWRAPVELEPVHLERDARAADDHGLAAPAGDPLLYAGQRRQRARDAPDLPDPSSSPMLSRFQTRPSQTPRPERHRSRSHGASPATRF
jgi:hypothetical protein